MLKELILVWVESQKSQVHRERGPKIVMAIALILWMNTKVTYTNKIFVKHGGEELVELLDEQKFQCYHSTGKCRRSDQPTRRDLEIWFRPLKRYVL